MESARIGRLLEEIRCQEIREAIQRQKLACCAPVVNSATIVPVESVIEKQQSDPTQWSTIFPGAQIINRPVTITESAKTLNLIQSTIQASTDPNVPDARFSIYRRPYVPPVCPPIPTYILNGNLPKSSPVISCPPQRFQGTISTCGTK
jgi:hypothetical protein